MMVLMVLVVMLKLWISKLFFVLFKILRRLLSVMKWKLGLGLLSFCIRLWMVVGEVWVVMVKVEGVVWDESSYNGD